MMKHACSNRAAVATDAAGEILPNPPDRSLSNRTVIALRRALPAHFSAGASTLV